MSDEQRIGFILADAVADEFEALGLPRETASCVSIYDVLALMLLPDDARKRALGRLCETIDA